jgi:hypothetical protein
MNVPQPIAPPAGPDLALRVVYMLLFAVIFWILNWMLAVAAIVQLALRLVNGRPQAELARIGAGLGRYARQIIEFMTFATESVPYPFSPWSADV